MKLRAIQLPRQTPYAVKVGLTVIGGVIVWEFAVKPFLGYIGIIDSAAESAFKKSVKDLSKIPSNDGSTKPTITQLQANEIANTLKSAMDRFGTKFYVMLDALKGLTGKDLQMVYAAFGVPKYFGTGRGEYFGTAASLFQWFDYELRNGQLEEMRYLWARSGLKF